MRRSFKFAGRFVRCGEGVDFDGYRMGRWRAFSTLRAAIRGMRLDMAELEADGLAAPLSVAIFHERRTRGGEFKDSEIVAIWKRGRIIWKDAAFVARERAKLCTRRRATPRVEIRFALGSPPLGGASPIRTLPEAPAQN
jgi:hypothetical protein